MHFIRKTLFTLTVGFLLSGCSTEVQTTPDQEAWKEQLHNNLAVLGARNWVVIAESSYPSYNGPGVSTLSTEQNSVEVFVQVLDALERGGYVQPRIMVCSELKNVDEGYAPGIKRYRAQINRLLPGRLHYELPSRIINGQIETATKQFKVLVIKTSTALPYSNIYIELDSGYWNSESESALRKRIEGLNRQHGAENSPAQKPGSTNTTSDTPSTDNLPPLPREGNGNTIKEPSALSGSLEVV